MPGASPPHWNAVNRSTSAMAGGSSRRRHLFTRPSKYPTSTTARPTSAATDCSLAASARSCAHGPSAARTIAGGAGAPPRQFTIWRATFGGILASRLPNFPRPRVHSLHHNLGDNGARLGIRCLEADKRPSMVMSITRPISTLPRTRGTARSALRSNGEQGSLSSRWLALSSGFAARLHSCLTGRGKLNNDGINGKGLSGASWRTGQHRQRPAAHMLSTRSGAPVDRTGARSPRLDGQDRPALCLSLHSPFDCQCQRLGDTIAGGFRGDLDRQHADERCVDQHQRGPGARRPLGVLAFWSRRPDLPYWLSVSHQPWLGALGARLTEPAKRNRCRRRPGGTDWLDFPSR